MTSARPSDARSLPQYPTYDRDSHTLFVSPHYFAYLQTLAHGIDEQRFEDEQRHLCRVYGIVPGTEVKVEVGV
jgi:hypothetical protein